MDPKFHLYLLIGQSNMAGRGPVDSESINTHPRVLMLTKDLAWVPARDPAHFDKPRMIGVGPGPAVGRLMAEADPDARIGLIPCAVGGTSIKVWVPGAEDEATRTHPYDDMLPRARKALKAGVLKGILWHQGEADLGEADEYGPRLIDLVARLRKDLRAPDVPFIAGEIAVFKKENDMITAEFNKVLHGLEHVIANYAVVSAEGLDHRGDSLHFDSRSARELGCRYARKMVELQKVIIRQRGAWSAASPSAETVSVAPKARK